MDRTYPEMPKLESTALILVDVLSSYEHDDAAPLKDSVEERLPQMEALVREAKERDVLTVYVNDNHEDWTQDRHTIMAGLKDSPNARLVDPLAPADDVPFITKGRHSIFWETPLAYLLQRSGIEHLVLIGQVTEQCILYSALDGYIRHFEITIPRDACATIDQEMEEAALRMMERNMHARITDAAHAFDL
jgi:nicotinamidase-related amidase